MRSRSFAALPPEVRGARARARAAARRHQGATRAAPCIAPTYLDFIGVKRFAADGKVIGEHRFLGLFTSAAYSMSPRQIPLLRPQGRSAWSSAPASRRPGMPARRSLNILETYPRDELFQTTEDELFQIAIGILQLQDRQRLAPVRAARPVRALRRLPGLRAARPLQHRPARADAAMLEQALNGSETRVLGPAVGIVAGAAPVHRPHARTGSRPIDVAELERAAGRGLAAAGPTAARQR